ncbi:MAG: glutathione S-transferase family protein [Alteraurantiacibacter sp.]
MAYELVTANRNYSSWSLRPWVLMKKLGITFTDRIEPFTKAVNWDDFRSFSPTGQVPVLIDGQRTVWDSLGIVLYLAQRHDGVWPEGDDARAFAQCGVAEMHGGFSALRNQCTMNVGVRVRMDAVDAALAKDLARVQELLEHGLDRLGGPWLAGPQFSALDAFFAPVAYRIRTFDLHVGHAQPWVERMLELPEMQEWEAMALAESWREQSHEAEIGAAGQIVADFRTG